MKSVSFFFEMPLCLLPALVEPNHCSMYLFSFLYFFPTGLCGGSASGKTTVANKIIEQLGVPWVSMLSLDSFYKVRVQLFTMEFCFLDQRRFSYILNVLFLCRF